MPSSHPSQRVTRNDVQTDPGADELPEEGYAYEENAEDPEEMDALDENEETDDLDDIDLPLDLDDDLIIPDEERVIDIPS